MATTSHPITTALRIMDAWLGLPEYTYGPTVYRFAHKLPPELVLEAVEIAQAKLPGGGESAFRYFCGVCNCMIQEQRIRQSWN
jgi:hypothetical protein